jgi:EmrB/QacA subfamily drug resistance transporter
MEQTRSWPTSAQIQNKSMRATLSQKRLILVVASMMLGMLLSALDQTVVGTAMPRVIADLNGLQHYAWVFTAYLLAATVAVPIYGKLSDIYGRRPFFLGGMVLFLLGSALSGASQNMTQLILFRAVQGLGGGAMMPITLAIFGDVFPPAERGKWQGLLMSVFGLATIIGPLIGGWITDNWGWRWTFYVNMPVGALALTTAIIALPAQSQRRQHAIDYLGSIALILGTIPLLLAFSWAGTEYAWRSVQIIGLLAFSVVMLALFAWVETRAVEPIIKPSFFKNGIFAVSVVATCLLSAGMFGAILYLPLFVQGVIGKTATNSGEVLMPMMIGFIVSSIVGGQILSRLGRYKAIALVAFVIAAAGMVLLSQMGIYTTEGVIIRNMIITGLGIGVMMSLFTIVVQNAFPFSELGQVTAGLQFFRSIAATIATAVLGTVMTNNFQSAFQANLPQIIKQMVPADKLAALQNPQVLLTPDATTKIQQAFAALGPQGNLAFEQLMHAIRVSLASAITSIFTVAAIAMVLGLMVTVFLKEVPLRKSHEPEAAPDAASHSYAAQVRRGPQALEPPAPMQADCGQAEAAE